MANRIIPPCDFHLHTCLSPCASQDTALSSLRAHAEAAFALGHEAICITDHFALPADWVPAWYANSGPDIIDYTVNAIRGIESGVKLFVGCEAEMVAPDRVTIDECFARRLDFVLLAASHLHFDGIGPPQGSPPAVVAAALSEFMEAAVSLPFIDAVAHPFAIPHEPGGDPAHYMELLDDDFFERVSDTAARNAIAFELNASQLAQEKYRLLLRRFYLIAKQHGVKFTLGSDAHCAGEQARVHVVESYARELGLVRGDFLDASDILERRPGRKSISP